MKTSGIGLGYSSMYEFLVKGSGMQPATAHRRTPVLNLIEEEPEVADLLKEGKLSVSNAAQIYQAIQTEEKLEKKEGRDSKLIQESMKEKLHTLIEETQGQSFRECQKTLAEVLPLQAEMRARRATETPVPDGRVQMVLMITPELDQKLKELKSLLSHIDPHPTPEALLEIMTDKLLKQLRKNKPESRDPLPTLEVEVSNPYSSHIPVSIQRQVWIQSEGKCEFTDHKTGKRCESTHQLEIDHCRPRAHGGTNELDNFRLLCRNHNQYQAWRHRLAG